MRRLLQLSLAGALAASALAAGAIAPAQADAVADVKVNEVESNGDTFDWVELVNTGATAADVSGWVVKDNDDTHAVTLPASTVIAPGGYLAINTDDPAVAGSFGLGGADSARVFAADGTTLVDSHSWTTHSAITYGRCPDSTGAFVTTQLATKGAANNCVSPVHITEVESSGDATDWIEVYNPSPVAADVSGFVVKDSDDTRMLTFPAGSVVAPQGYLAIDTDPIAANGFGLGSSDSARIFAADGTTLVSSYSWTAHAATTWGRCPGPNGDFILTAAGTRGAANNCGVVVPTGLTINEVESNGDTFDWVEVTNTSAAPVDISGFVVKDNDDTHAVTVAPGTVVPSGGFVALNTDDPAVTGSFGLGGADSARIFASDGTTLVDLVLVDRPRDHHVGSLPRRHR